MFLEIAASLPMETKFFIGVISIAFLLLHVRFNAKAVANGPTILTTLGIFATFFGIAVGLAKFDSTNIQASIPQLLDGLKTAFWASVFGVGCALTLKFRDHFFGYAESAEGNTDQEIGAAEVLGGLTRVERALVGGEEGSLISQLKFLRTETRDELRQLREAQIKALEKLSEMGSKALIEALRDVIRDFNNNLTEQFGENFKQLNLAVGKLVEWQEQYRLYIEATTEKLDQVQQLLSKATTDYSQTLERASEFSRIAESVGLTLNELNSRNDELKTQSEALANLLLQASGSLPAVESKILELARQLSDGVAANQKTLDDALLLHLKNIELGVQRATEGVAKHAEEAAESISRLAVGTNERLAATAKDLQDRIEDNHNAVGRALTENASNFSVSIKEVVANAVELTSEQSKRVTDAAEKAHVEFIGISQELVKTADQANQLVSKTMLDGADTLRESMRSTIEAVSAANAEHNKQLLELVSRTKENVTVLDTALGEELERSLNSLGRQLTALSEKFVSDYSPLTESLRRVVEMARRASVQ